jgi:diaminopimelate decarboxylase
MENIFAPYFYFKNGELFCENVKLQDIAKNVGTPVYVYSKKAIEDKINEYKEAFKDYPTLICYACKANSNLSILNIFNKYGFGLDTVSGGEIFKGLLAGFPTDRIVYAGVGKTDEELELAINKEILSFNVESKEELDVINEIAKKLGKKANISIRVNPDVDPKTHPYISTGLKKSKFGIDIDEALDTYIYASKLKNLNIVGIHCHIGSQILDISPFKEAIQKVIDLINQLKKKGIYLQFIDVGGGIGIKYRPEDNPPKIKDLANLIIPIIKETGLKLLLEPGRSLIGEAGALISKVIFTKDKKEKHFIIVDAGMNDLTRPSIYEAYHHIYPLKKKDKVIKADIVGPICETGDFLALDREIDNVKRGDYIAIMSAGAYGSSMSSNYNDRPRASEVLVDGDKYFIIKKRENYGQLVENEIEPFIKITE